MFNKLITPDIFYDINIPSELKHVFHEEKKITQLFQLADHFRILSDDRI